MKRNICFIGNFSGGGTERVVFYLTALLEQTSEYNIFVLNTNPGNLTFSLPNDCYYECVEPGNIIKRAFAIRKFIRDKHINSLISVEALTGIFTIAATLFSGCRNIVWEHANYYQTQGSRWTKLVRRLWLMYADFYVVLTKKDLDNFLSNERFIWCKLISIYNANHLVAMSNSYSVNSKKIVSVGHIRGIKNFVVIPRLFVPISKKCPDWTWHIYGSGKEKDVKALESEIRKYNLQDKVILEGRVNDLEMIYKDAGIYVLTSLQEGLPTVLIEAMSYGIPCISFDIETGPNEIIDDGENGYLVSAYDEDMMREKIKILVSNDSLRQQFSSATVNSLKKFDTKKIIDEWLKIL